MITAEKTKVPERTMTADSIEGSSEQAFTEALPAYPPVYEETAEKLKQLYLSGKWSFNGQYEQEFSRNFAQHHDAAYGIFMVNGTVTLEAALHALGIKAGDEVIVPALTWLATAMAVIYNGAVPVFVDIEPDTLCLDPKKVKEAITPETKAIIPVHLYGSMADMEKLLEIAKEYNLYVVEDCAHAHGGVWSGRGVGSLGHIGSFSFQQSKTLAGGEGGICLTNDPELREKLFRIKHIGYDLDTKQGQAQSGPEEGLICHNYRGMEFTALILNDAVKALKEQTEKRDISASLLRNLLKDIPGVKIQARGRLADLQGYYRLVLLFEPEILKSGITLNQIQEELAAEGLATSLTYGPVYKHMLWNIPLTKYRIHSNINTEDICTSRAVCISHELLLGNRALIIKIAEVIQKTLKNYYK